MKKVFFTLIVLLIFSRTALPQIFPDTLCQAEFDWKVNEQIMMFAPGMAVNFYGLSKPEAESWFWDFGDGSFSEEQNPLHIFTFLNGSNSGISDDGFFIPRVCLTIKTKEGCSSSICKTLETYSDTVIYPDSGCFVYFYPYRNDSIISIPEVTPYSFKVSVPENTVSYLWDFGDGSTSEEANPVHSFNNMDPARSLYNVCLTINTSDKCTNSYCAPIFVGYNDSIIEPECQAAYTYMVNKSNPPQYVFQDLSLGNPTDWFWDFGDGSFSNEQNPVHIFQNNITVPGETGFRVIPYEGYYKVCLTTLADNCKSSYCDYVYVGGEIDTIYPQPCPYYISITTSNTLGGNFCNGKASASLVDAAGNTIEATDFYWSTGETGTSATGLCVNSPYYVSITGADGCQIVGSFAIIDYNQSIDPFGFWTIYGNGSYYDLKYAVPDSGYSCNWEFSDGTTLNGENVKYAFDGSFEKSVTLKVLDAMGNVVYTEQIALNQATAVKETKVDAVKLYPNPVVDQLHIQLNGKQENKLHVEIYNSLGQKRLSEHFIDATSSSEITVSVSSLERGIYYARILGVGNSPVTMSFVK